MTRMSIRELVESWRPRYLGASRKEKSRILDEFVALTGYHRKSAIRLLPHGYRPKPLPGRSTTKPGTLLKGQIPVRTFADWDDARPGFLEWGEYQGRIPPHPDRGGHRHPRV